MNRRAKRFIAKWVILLCTVTTTLTLKPWKLVPKLASKERTAHTEEIKNVAINHILSNELSDLPETKKMERAIERFMREWGIIGASLAISKDGKLVYSKGFGYADKEANVTMGVNNIFRIASVSKLVTAVGIMKLYEQGKLSLSDKVFGKEGLLNDPYYLDIVDKRIRNITVENLLRHQGGFSLRGGDPMFSTQTVANKLKCDLPISMEDMVRYATMSRLAFEPGKGTRYSNLGYLVLSKIIEKVSKKSYFSYIEEDILKPIGCYDIQLARNMYEQRYSNEVKYYEPKDDEPIPAFFDTSILKPKCYGGNNVRGLYGAGGLVASPSELLKLVAAIDYKNDKENIISNQSIDYMTSHDKGRLPIGWMHTNEKGVWWRTGTLSGSSVMLKRQNDGYSWVFITNTSSWKGAGFTKKIDAMVRKALNTVDQWPERDMFEFDESSIDSLINQ